MRADGPPGVSIQAAIGVDLGGTKMLVGVVGEGDEVLEAHSEVSAGRTESELLDLLVETLAGAIERHPEVVAIGLGVPCTIDRRSGRCVNAVNLPITDLPLGEIVATRVDLPVSLDNDANLALLAEHRFGAAAGARNAAMLTIGTGIGGGLMFDGRIYRGSRGAGAELGHMVVDIDGPACQGSCPNRGCIESIASGTALAREGADAADRAPDSELARVRERGEAIDGLSILAAARGGDETALAVLERVGRRLGAALSGIANALDPDVIVLGGGVMAAGELLLGPAREELLVRALPPQREVPVRAAALGAAAGMIGAACFAREQLALAAEVG